MADATARGVGRIVVPEQGFPAGEVNRLARRVTAADDLELAVVGRSVVPPAGPTERHHQPRAEVA